LEKLPKEIEFEFIEVTNRIAVAQFKGLMDVNAAAIALDNFIVVIDTLYYPVQSREFRNRVEEKYNLPVKYVLITHFHGDHETMNNEPVGMHDSVTFIQILDSSKLKELTSKFIQWKNLERSINNILPVKESNITDYRLFYGNRSDFMNREKYSDLVVCIQEACR